MANTSQALNLEGIIHREMHGIVEQIRIINKINAHLVRHLATNNPHPSTAPVPKDADRSRHAHRSGNQDSYNSHSASQGHSTRRWERSPRRDDQAHRRGDKSTTQNIKDLDARIDAINIGMKAPVTMDALIRQTKLLFKVRVMKVRVSSKFKLPSQLKVYEGKANPMDHLDSYNNLMMLQGYSDEVMCKAFSATLKGPTRVRQKNASYLFTVYHKDGESLKDYVRHFIQVVMKVEDPSDKVVVMAIMEDICLGPLFNSLSKSVSATLSALQSKADKYIAVEELAEAKRRRRGKDDHKRNDSTCHNQITSSFDEIDPLNSNGFTSP
ncbi:hypothetical protein Acr_00g0094950 [Actinidia rufa]|uniref:Uncharacterized protein n=1 Tax=Actinidia rufa TaxID=165716 RepID=A0A7J0DYJ6_9ERIC|nr:hypothetical protein Acr_00g0094950 [Actinidia rufa]